MILKDVLSIVCALLAFGCALLAAKYKKKADSVEKENSELTFTILTGEKFDD